MGALHGQTELVQLVDMDGLIAECDRQLRFLSSETQSHYDADHHPDLKKIDLEEVQRASEELKRDGPEHFYQKQSDSRKYRGCDKGTLTRLMVDIDPIERERFCDVMENGVSRMATSRFIRNNGMGVKQSNIRKW